MYTGLSEHNPPHFHVYYQDSRASFSIVTGELIDGLLGVRQIRLVQAWIELHKEELQANWMLARKGEKLVSIDPIK